MLGLERPHKHLLALYLIRALATVVMFPIVFPLLFFRYQTLRYRFDATGITVSWGILFHQENVVNYRKIQDIHVNRGLLERWLGLGNVAIQTASGSAGAEITLEGLEDTHAVRDFLYARMRGAKGQEPAAAADEAADGDEVVALLQGIRDDLRGVREALGTPAAKPKVSLRPPATEGEA